MTRCGIWCCLVFVSLLANVACAGVKTPAQADLAQRRFVLADVDGVPFAAGQRPDISFSEDFRVSGRMCNRYTGQGTLQNGVLTVKQMASTKMLCIDAALNRLEGQFGAMLAAGAHTELTGDTLTLRQGGHVLVFRRTTLP